MSIEPDGKDWTWVLERACPDCGFDAALMAPSDAGSLLRENAARWAEILGRPPAFVRSRPHPGQWSPLEYGCHVRDVCIRFDERLALMLSGDDPLFENWDQDATALEDRYDLQAPAAVAREIVTAADALASRFDRVSGTQWERSGRRSDGATFTVASLARYLLHDPIHHVHDVESTERGDTADRR